MFELLATVDPFAALLGSLWLFAAGMFPVGFMLGSSCSPCCGCSACTQGSLPETITATLDGFTDYEKQYLTNLTFSACYGSGAAGRVETPGHATPGTDPIPDRGPIGSVSLSNGGSGYAKLGRTAPTVTVTGTSGSGTGATFAVTLASSKDSCGLDRWAVSKVERTGGTGYQTGDTLTFAIAEGETQEIAAAATIGGTTYSEPTLTATVSGGAGGVLSINGYTKLIGGMFDGYYVPTGITVVSGGSGYADNAQVTLSLGTNDEWAPGSGAPNIRIRTALRAPADEWILDPGSVAPTGTGFILEMVLEKHPTSPWWYAIGAGAWEVGSGYAVGQRFRPRAVDGAPESTLVRATIEITDVDENGGVLGLEIIGSGRYAVGTGEITSVVITSNRPARKAITEDVSVSSGGVYYREDASLPPYVATVTVGVNQTAPSQGSGASISATVGSDPANAETFGKITGLAVNSGGSGYLAWEWTTNDCCGHYLNGKSVVLKRVPVSNSAICNLATVDFTPGDQYFSVSSSCVYTHRFCGGWVDPFLFGEVWDRTPQRRALQLYVGFTGEGQPAVAKLVRACGPVSSDENPLTACEQEWISDATIDTCPDFQWSQTNANGVSISVTQSGTYDPEWRFLGCENTASQSCNTCGVCCQGEEEVPEEIEVVVTDEWTSGRPSGMPNFSGTYVATGGPNYWVFGGIPTGFIGISGGFGINPCHDGTMPFYVTANRGSCKTCIKKCRVWFSQIGFEWYYQFAGLTLYRRARIAPLPPTTECGDCENTPVCSPSGKSFSLNSADPAIIGYGDSEHAATVTIQ